MKTDTAYENIKDIIIQQYNSLRQDIAEKEFAISCAGILKNKGFERRCKSIPAICCIIQHYMGIGNCRQVILYIFLLKKIYKEVSDNEQEIKTKLKQNLRITKI